MKTEWDYSSLAKAYLKRPDYSPHAIRSMLKTASIKKGDRVCDIGAGVAHLTLHLLDAGLKVSAVEPNDEMRKFGMKRTSKSKKIKWIEASGTETAQEKKYFDLVTYGSSFNVMDRSAAMLEAKRILKKKGWMACMWNHRKLSDPIQSEIEKIISNNIPEYNYGTRREDQTDIINQSKLFSNVIRIESDILHKQTITACIEAWRSHGTLARQAGDKFEKIMNEISDYLSGLGVSSIMIPYTTAIWMAQLK